jgi:hypothetical protein
MVHSIDVILAREIGLKEAILLHHINLECYENKKNNINFVDGYYWSHIKLETLAQIYSYLGSASSLRRALNNLEDLKLIKTGNYNKVKFDRTKWYTLTDKGLKLINKAV